MRFHMKKGSAKTKTSKRKQSKAQAREKPRSEGSSSEVLGSDAVNLDSRDGRLVYDGYKTDRGPVPSRTYPPNLPDMVCVSNQATHLVNLDNCSGNTVACRPENNNNIIPNRKQFNDNRYVSLDRLNLDSERISECYRYPASFEGGKMLLPEQKVYAMEQNPLVLSSVNPSLTVAANGVTNLPYPLQ